MNEQQGKHLSQFRFKERIMNNGKRKVDQSLGSKHKNMIGN